MVAQGGAAYNRGTLALERRRRSRTTRPRGPTVLGRAVATPTPGGPATGGGVYSEGALTLEGSTLRGNSAIGGQGPTGASSPDRYAYPGGPGGDGTGGGLYVAGGSVWHQQLRLHREHRPGRRRRRWQRDLPKAASTGLRPRGRRGRRQRQSAVGSMRPAGSDRRPAYRDHSSNTRAARAGRVVHRAGGTPRTGQGPGRRRRTVHRTPAPRSILDSYTEATSGATRRPRLTRTSTARMSLIA